MVMGWFSTVLALPLSVVVTELVFGWRIDSGRESRRMAGYGFPPLAQAFPLLTEYGALALLGIIVTRVCVASGYPASLTAALYAVLAYGYLLGPAVRTAHGHDFARIQPSPITAVHQRSLSPLVTLAGLAIALLFPIPAYRQPFVHLLMVHAGLSWITAWELTGTGFKIAAVAAIVFIVVCAEQRSLESIGWRTSGAKDVVLGVAAFVATQAVILLTVYLAEKALPGALAETRAGGAMYAGLPLPLNLLDSICSGVAEEIGFRGYALERLSEITGSRWLGAGIPYVIEVLCHAPVWGFHGMLLKAPPLLILVLLYLWQRSLPACILAHVLSDVIPTFW